MKLIVIALLLSSITYADTPEAIGKRFDDALTKIKADCSHNWTDECRARLKLAVDQEDKDISAYAEPHKTEKFIEYKPEYPGPVACVNASNAGITLPECY